MYPVDEETHIYICNEESESEKCKRVECGEVRKLETYIVGSGGFGHCRLRILKMTGNMILKFGWCGV